MFDRIFQYFWLIFYLAAHCLQDKNENEPKAPRDVNLLFGAHKIHDVFEQGRFIMSVAEIVIHKDWNPGVQRYDADLALLFTDENIPITRFIKPLCLWQHNVKPRVSEGFISGWGLSEFTIEEHEMIPKKLKVPIVDQIKCLFSNNNIVVLASERTFCGGYKNGTGPCHGKNKFNLRNLWWI